MRSKLVGVNLCGPGATLERSKAAGGRGEREARGVVPLTCLRENEPSGSGGDKKMAVPLPVHQQFALNRLFVVSTNLGSVFESVSITRPVTGETFVVARAGSKDVYAIDADKWQFTKMCCLCSV